MIRARIRKEAAHITYERAGRGSLCSFASSQFSLFVFLGLWLSLTNVIGDPLQWKEAFSTLAPNGMDQLQFQMFLRKMGLPSAALRDPNLVTSLYRVFDKNDDKTIAWKEFYSIMRVFASTDIDAQLERMLCLL